MKLAPTLRKKRRYFLLENTSISQVEEEIIHMLGVLGYAKVDPIFFQKNNSLILAVSREEVNAVRAVFALTKKDMRIIKVSGTLAGLKRK